MNTIEHVLSVQTEMGETPIWVPEEQAVYWVSIPEKNVYRLHPSTSEYRSFQLDMPVRALCRRASGGWLIVTNTGLAFWDPQTNTCSFITDPCAHDPDLQLNDGTVDRQGHLLVGSYNRKKTETPPGSLYRLDHDLSLHKLDTDLAISNGIGVSPDSTTLYVSEMFTNSIIAYDYDAIAGTVSNRRPFVRIPEDAGKPDGLVVDSEGFVWNAHWGGWRVSRYDPVGKLEREIKLPVEIVTCMGFGGSDLDELYITTAWFRLSEQQRKEQPFAGDLFRIKTDIKGLAEPKFLG